MTTSVPGTCHLMSCPGKGTRDHHALGTTIGAPTQESWERQSNPPPPERNVPVPKWVLTRVTLLLTALETVPDARHEVGILVPALREALGWGKR